MWKQKGPETLHSQPIPLPKIRASSTKLHIWFLNHHFRNPLIPARLWWKDILPIPGQSPRPSVRHGNINFRLPTGLLNIVDFFFLQKIGKLKTTVKEICGTHGLLCFHIVLLQHNRPTGNGREIMKRTKFERTSILVYVCWTSNSKNVKTETWHYVKEIVIIKVFGWSL